MIHLWIDNQEVEVPAGATILEAADKLGIGIPTLCFRKTCTPSTSCYACVVKVEGLDHFVPSCATAAHEGMRVGSQSPEVLDARKAALELLLSDHVGDCMAPCHSICPANMDIPLMLRQIAAGDLRGAIAMVKADIPLPAILGRICPAPCEKGCRRRQHDAAVAICALKRFVADTDLAAEHKYMPACKPVSGKKVAIIGAGPAGLSAAYCLQMEGHACTVFDDHPCPGGMLRYGVTPDRLPREVIDAEVATVESLGAAFRLGVKVGLDVSLDDVRKEFDAVLLATGPVTSDDVRALSAPPGEHGIGGDRRTSATTVAGVFAAGGAVGRGGRLAVRALADGKAAAASIAQYLQGRPVVGPQRPFTCHVGPLHEGEMAAFLAAASAAPREEPAGAGRGFTNGQAAQQSLRCLHCDCRKSGSAHSQPYPCKLRVYAQQYLASPSRYGQRQRTFHQQLDHPQVIYESGKCIACGLCIQIARQAGETLGLAFVGRGFDVRVGVPFDKPLAEALVRCAARCAQACPTGAISLKAGAPP